MIEDKERDKTNNSVKCPICDLDFKDDRGLTSHARNKHDLEKGEVFKKMTQKEQEKKEWRVFGGIGAILITAITLGRLR